MKIVDRDLALIGVELFETELLLNGGQNFDVVARIAAQTGILTMPKVLDVLEAVSDGKEKWIFTGEAKDVGNGEVYKCSQQLAASAVMAFCYYCYGEFQVLDKNGELKTLKPTLDKQEYMAMILEMCNNVSALIRMHMTLFALTPDFSQN